MSRKLPLKFSCYCRKCTIKRSAARQQKNKIKIKEYLKTYRKENKESISKTVSKYAKNNAAEIREYKRKYNNTRRKTDVNYKLKGMLRSRIKHAIRNQKTKQPTKSSELLGCIIDIARGHLEKQFQVGMNWENQGQWHIDHIRPCATYDLTDPGQQKKCFHYTNLQPLWAEDNLKKGATL